MRNFLRDKRQRLTNQVRQTEIRCAVELLAMTENPNQSHGVLFHNIRSFRRHFASAENKAVQTLHTLRASHAKEFSERKSARCRRQGQGQPLLDQRRSAVDRLSVLVIIMHEVLDSTKHVSTMVTQMQRDFWLSLQREDIGGVFARKVKFVSNS